MIEVAEALDKILSKVPKNPVVEIGLTSALNCVFSRECVLTNSDASV